MITYKVVMGCCYRSIFLTLVINFWSEDALISAKLCFIGYCDSYHYFIFILFSDLLSLYGIRLDLV